MSDVSSIKHPAAVLSRVNIFGNPFHGLVVAPSYGGLGTLDHGGPSLKSVQMPFSADCWRYHLNGVPPVERTEAQSAADAEAGHVWLSDVVLNRTMLYGRLLFAPDFPNPRVVDFLWKDDNGTTWGIGFTKTLASVVAAGNDIELCITKFGLIGNGSDEFRYVTKSTGIEYLSAGIDPVIHNAYLTPASYFLYDVNSDGSAAIVGLCGASNTLFDDPFPRRVSIPVGFIELRVGLGDDGWPDITVITLANTIQVLGSVFAHEDYAADTTYEEFFVPPSTTYEVATSSFVNYTTTVELTGKIVAMFYQEDSPVSVTISRHGVSTYSMVGSAAVTAVSGGYNVEAEKTITQSRTLSVSVSYAGVTIYDYFNDGPPAVTTFNQSGSIGSVSGYPEDDQGYGEGVLNTDYYDETTRGDRLLQGELALSPPGVSFGAVLHGYTRKVWGAIWPESGNLVFGTIGTPSGLVSGGSPVPESGSPPVYRSYDPITNQLSDRYSTPVCFI